MAFPDDYPVDQWHQLCAALGGSADSFTGQLLTLMGKADPGNRARLQRAYPREYAALQWWKEAPSPRTLGQLRDHLAELITAATADRTEDFS